MAGSYPDAPSWRMAIDRDGTQGYVITGANVVTPLTNAQLQILNNESDDYVEVGTTTGSRVMLIFPELRDIDGFFLDVDPESSSNIGWVVEVSANTTNGVDGTWTQIASGSATPTVDPVVPAYRSVISVTQLAKRAIRVRRTDSVSGALRAASFHVYGEPAPGENPDRLALWHPTLDERVPPAYFDWGNVPRSSSGDRLFRVKNLSSTLTASAVRVAMETLTDGTPSIPGQHSLSFGGGSFLAQANVGDLAPGAISGPVTLRRVTPGNAQLGLWAFRVFAEANAWN